MARVARFGAVGRGEVERTVENRGIENRGSAKSNGFQLSQMRWWKRTRVVCSKPTRGLADSWRKIGESRRKDSTGEDSGKRGTIETTGAEN